MNISLPEVLAIAGFLGIAFVVWDRVTNPSEFKEASAAAYGGAGYSASPMNEGTGFSGTIENQPDRATGATQYTLGVDPVGLDQSAPSTTLRADGYTFDTMPVVGPVSVDPFNGYVPRLPVNAVRPLIPVIGSSAGPQALTYASESRAGDNQVNSSTTSETLNGVLGQPALPPGTNESYLDMSNGTVKTVAEWRRSHTMLAQSDTLIRAVPFSGGIECMLRRV